MASIGRRPDGLSRARWREYQGGPQRSKHFDRKVDASRYLVDVQHRILAGTYTPPEAGLVTVRTYSAEWTSRRKWAPSTTQRIERELRLHILPRLGDRPLSSLRRSHIEECVNQLNLKASSAPMVFETLSNLLASAVDDERIPRNPATGARVATGEEVPFVPLEVDRCATSATPWPPTSAPACS